MLSSSSLLATLVVTALSGRLVETPFLRLKARRYVTEPALPPVPV